MHLIIVQAGWSDTTNSWAPQTGWTVLHILSMVKTCLSVLFINRRAKLFWDSTVTGDSTKLHGRCMTPLVRVLGWLASTGNRIRCSSGPRDWWIHAVKSVYGLNVVNLIKMHHRRVRFFNHGKGKKQKLKQSPSSFSQKQKLLWAEPWKWCECRMLTC